jgi:3-oxoacyl-[acyl-carrier protein] reductase
VDEIKAAGGDAIAVGGDVAADDFPATILDATIKYAHLIPPLHSFLRCALLLGLFLFYRRYGKLNHLVNNGAFGGVCAWPMAA